MAINLWRIKLSLAAIEILISFRQMYARLIIFHTFAAENR